MAFRIIDFVNSIIYIEYLISDNIISVISNRVSYFLNKTTSFSEWYYLRIN